MTVPTLWLMISIANAYGPTWRHGFEDRYGETIYPIYH